MLHMGPWGDAGWLAVAAGGCACILCVGLRCAGDIVVDARRAGSRAPARLQTLASTRTLAETPGSVLVQEGPGNTGVRRMHRPLGDTSRFLSDYRGCHGTAGVYLRTLL